MIQNLLILFGGALLGGFIVSILVGHAIKESGIASLATAFAR